MTVLLRERLEVLVAQAQVEGQSRGHAPVILHESGVDPGAEIVRAGPKAHRRHLRESQQEVREVKPCAGHWSALRREVARRVAAEGKGAARVRVGKRVAFDAAQLAAYPHVVLAAVHEDRIEGPHRLAADQRGNDVAQTAEIGKGDHGQAPVPRVLRNTLNSQLPSNVLLKSEGIQGRASLPVEAERKRVDRVRAEGVRLAQAQVLAAHRNVLRKAGETAHRLGARGIKEIKGVEAVLGGNLLAYTGHDAVVVRRQRFLEVEVLHASRQVRQRDVLEQALRRRIDGRNPIAGERLTRAERIRLRIVNRRDRSGEGAGGDNALREIALTLLERGHRRETVKRALAALQVVVYEEAGLVRAMIDFGDHERAADGGVHPLLIVGNLTRLRHIQGIGMSVKSGV